MEDLDRSINSLLAAMILQAMRDLVDRDLNVARDAYQWLMTDGPLYFEALGIDRDIRSWTQNKWKQRETQGDQAARRDWFDTLYEARAIRRETA